MNRLNNEAGEAVQNHLLHNGPDHFQTAGRYMVIQLEFWNGRWQTRDSLYHNALLVVLAHLDFVIVGHVVHHLRNTVPCEEVDECNTCYNL